MNSEELFTPRLKLRPINSYDLPDIYMGLSDPKVIKYYGVSFTSLIKTEEQMTWYRDLRENNTGIWWAIEDIITTNFLGAIGLHNVSLEKKQAELGFWLLPDYWGKGFMYEAAKQVLNFSWQELQLYQLVAYVEDENASSMKLLEKLKFTRKEFHENFERKGDHWISVHGYYVDQSDW